MHHYGQPLSVSVKDGKLVIEIGIHTLAHAVAFADWANKYGYDDPDHPGYWRSFAIADPTQFAEDVKLAMLHEDEIGASRLSDFLDKTTELAVDDGSLGLAEGEHWVEHGSFAEIETWAEREHRNKSTVPRKKDSDRGTDKFSRDRDATCAWDCTLPYPHDGPCGR